MATNSKKSMRIIHKNFFPEFCSPKLYNDNYGNPSRKKVDNPSRVMAKMLDCTLKVSKFKLKSRLYVHFQLIPLGRV